MRTPSASSLIAFNSSLRGYWDVSLQNPGVRIGESPDVDVWVSPGVDREMGWVGA